LYGAARIGELVVISNFRPTPGWAVVLLSVVALSLAGCGRKGPLDLPPTASNVPPQGAATDTAAEQAAKPSLFNSGSDVAPAAPRGARKPFILDPILGDPYQPKTDPYQASQAK
jgi:predicted small lipoprotein YifL